MAWLSVNKDNTENICDCEPTRCTKYGIWESFTSIEGETIDFTIEIPKGSIEKLTGKLLTWNDLPIEI